MNKNKDNATDDLRWLDVFNFLVEELTAEAENLANAKNVNEYNKTLKRLYDKYGFQNNMLTCILGMTATMLFDKKLEGDAE